MPNEDLGAYHKLLVASNQIFIYSLLICSNLYIKYMLFVNKDLKILA